MRFMRVKAMIEPAAAGERAAGEAGPRAAADDGHLVLRGKCNRAGDIGSAARKGDDVGAALFDRAVVFIVEHVFRQVQHGRWTEKLLEFANEDLSHKRRSLGNALFTIRKIAWSAQRRFTTYFENGGNLGAIGCGEL